MLSSLAVTGLAFRRLLRVAFAVLATQACGGDASDAGETAPADRGATQADVAATCGAVCEYSERCPGSEDEEFPGQSCRSTCVADFGSGALLQQRVLHAYQDCFSELSCAQSDDSCLGIVVETLELDLTSPLLQRCYSVQDECGGFIDDVCSFALLATPAGQTRLDQCLSLACNAVPACIDVLSE